MHDVGDDGAAACRPLRATCPQHAGCICYSSDHVVASQAVHFYSYCGSDRPAENACSPVPQTRANPRAGRGIFLFYPLGAAHVGPYVGPVCPSGRWRFARALGYACFYSYFPVRFS